MVLHSIIIEQRLRFRSTRGCITKVLYLPYVQKHKLGKHRVTLARADPHLALSYLSSISNSV